MKLNFRGPLLIRPFSINLSFLVIFLKIILGKLFYIEVYIQLTRLKKW